MMYYILDTQDPEFLCRWIEKEPNSIRHNYDLGEKFTYEVDDPLKFTLEPIEELSDDSGPEMPAVFIGNHLMLRDDFIQSLLDFGVSNFDAYRTEMFDPDNRETYTNYKAVNIIGLVSMADISKSTATVHNEAPLIDVDFDKLVLDEAKASEFVFFRLAESSIAIMVREDLKNYLVEKGFDHVCFGDPATMAI